MPRGPRLRWRRRLHHRLRNLRVRARAERATLWPLAMIEAYEIVKAEARRMETER